MKEDFQANTTIRQMERIEKINSILFAAFISETLICSMLGKILDLPNLAVIVSGLLLICVFFFNRTISRKIISLIVAAVIIMLLVMISFVFNGGDSTLNYFSYFLCFGGVSIFLVSIKYDIEYLIKTLIRIYTCYIIFYVLFVRRTLLSRTGGAYWDEQIGRAYAFLPIILIAVILILYRKLFTIRKYEQIVMVFMGMLAFIFLIFDCGTRGTLVSLALSVIILLIIKEKNVKRNIIILGIGIAAVFILNYYQEILRVLQSVLDSYGIKIVALDKMIFLMDLNSADNGRTLLYEAARKYFYSSPIIGHGVGYFEKMQGSYVHNIFLEILCEYGVIGMIFAGGFLIFNFAILIRGEISQTKIFGAFLFCISIPMLLFNNTYWLVPQFWIYFFWTSSKYREMRKQTSDF